jgi:hypothetical protein
MSCLLRAWFKSSPTLVCVYVCVLLRIVYMHMGRKLYSLRLFL